METRRIGSLEVSVVGLGTNNFGMGMGADEVPPVVDAALEAGINFFDTSDSYGDSEERLGEALGTRRDEVVIATKFGSPVGGATVGGARPDYVRSAVERSLKKLDTDRIDLYQLHRPDPETPIADTLGTLGELVDEGQGAGDRLFELLGRTAPARPPMPCLRDGPGSSACRTSTTCSTARTSTR